MEDDKEYSLVCKGSFNASHFFYGGKLREELHGHNYFVTIKLKSHENEIFERVGKVLQNLCEEMNNKVIIAADPPIGDVCELEYTQKVVLPDGTYYEFPKKDCFFIQGVSSSAECIGFHIFEAVKCTLENNWEKAKIVVSEIYGQQEIILRVTNSINS